jgi:ribosomal protein S18 acetylase RimI-like enzyme
MLALEPIKQLNIDNLTRLWKQMGLREPHDYSLQQLNVCANWPHRHWLDWGTQIKAPEAVRDFAERVPETAIIPVWDSNPEHPAAFEKALIASDLEATFSQTAMALAMPTESVAPSIELEVTEIAGGEELDHWVRIGSAAFGYQINPSAIRNVLKCENAQVLLARLQGKPVATGLLFETAPVIGIHQVGVDPNYQGQGIALALMQILIERCRVRGGEAITLQASVVGKPLYDRLGFTSLFTIRNYQRVPPA